MPRPLASSACLLLTTVFIAPAFAEDSFWAHKDWRSVADTTQAGQRQCLAMTGGDGDDMLKVETTPAGDLTVYFEEQTYRGMATNLQPTDHLVFELDTTPASRYTSVTTSVGYDDEGIPQARATIAAADAPALLAAMRSAGTLTITRATPQPDHQPTVARLSLAGFTANYLKASEWCGLEPVAAQDSP